MPRANRAEPMPVKHFSRAGLMLTNWCNAACESCYLHCGPSLNEWMSVEQALAVWEQLLSASPHGCRVHITGGEPFGDWDRLLSLCQQAHRQGLGPLEAIETNAFWATDAGLVAERLKALDSAGLGKLTISADPYHQQFVPISLPRLAARVAHDVLGPHRVQVRWRDWLTDGFDTSSLDEPERLAFFAAYAARGRDRFNGRAAGRLAAGQEFMTAKESVDSSCRRQVLRSGHVHVCPGGEVTPGTCGGIVIGKLGADTVSEVWRRLDRDYAKRPIVSALCARGPAGLRELARETSFVPRQGYMSKCHFCRDIRGHLLASGRYDSELGPRWQYGILPRGGNRPASQNVKGLCD